MPFGLSIYVILYNRLSSKALLSSSIHLLHMSVYITASACTSLSLPSVSILYPSHPFYISLTVLYVSTPLYTSPHISLCVLYLPATVCYLISSPRYYACIFLLICGTFPVLLPCYYSPLHQALPRPVPFMRLQFVYFISPLSLLNFFYICFSYRPPSFLPLVLILQSPSRAPPHTHCSLPARHRQSLRVHLALAII